MTTCRTCRAIHPFHVPIPVDPHLLERARWVSSLPHGTRGAEWDALAGAAGVSRRTLQRYAAGGRTLARYGRGQAA
jgi:hypothetical protein